MYLKRYHDIDISNSGVWRILKRVDLSRLPAYQRYQRHDCNGNGMRSRSPGTWQHHPGRRHGLGV